MVIARTVDLSQTRQMAYDLVFWTDLRGARPDPKVIYQALLDEQPVEGLGPFQTSQVLAALSGYFPGLTPSNDAVGSTVWEAPDASSIFEFSWSPQHLLAVAHGTYSDEQMNSIIEVCVEIGGGRLYDPQTDERFDP